MRGDHVSARALALQHIFFVRFRRFEYFLNTLGPRTSLHHVAYNMAFYLVQIDNGLYYVIKSDFLDFVFSGGV